MSVQVEKLEKNMAKLVIEVPAEEFEKALDEAYKKSRNKIAMPGFRKGKAPRKMIEKLYGESFFFEKGTPFIFAATVAVKPEITLGDYKGIEIEKKTAEVTDEEVDAEISRVRENNSRMITVDDRATQEGDTVIIDFDGYVDGEQFEGGKAEDYSLVLGSHTFIDNFEEQLVGKNPGDSVEVHVTFPDMYQAEELRGKEAVFYVEINDIKVKELPEIDDEFAQDVSDFDTLEEYKEDLKKKLLENKEAALEREKEEEVIGAIIENSQMEIPDPMVDAQTRQMTQEFAQRLQAQGLSMEQYMQLTGLTPQKMIDELKPQALKRIQSRLVLEAVAAAENIEVSDEEYDKEIDKIAEAYNMEKDKLTGLVSDNEKEQIRMDIAVQKAVELVVASAVEKSQEN